MTGKRSLDRLTSRRKELAALYRELHFQRRSGFLPNSAASDQRRSPVDFKQVGWVEDLVLQIELDERPAFTLTPRHKKEPEIHANPVGQALLSLDCFCCFAVDPKFSLSPRVRLFIHCLIASRQSYFPNFPSRLDGTQKAQDLLLPEIEALNGLVASVRRALNTPGFRSELNKEQGIADRRYEETRSYVSGLIRKAGEVVVIPLEFSTAFYWRRTARIREGEDPRPPLVKWFNSFKAKARHYAAMRHVLGFVGRWEVNESIGLYARVLFFLEATRIPDGKAAADAIATLWAEHTEKKGVCHPSYLTEEDQDKAVTVLQVGKRVSRQRRQLLEVALLSLCKQEMVFRDISLEFDRFFRGESRSLRRRERATQQPASMDPFTEPVPAVGPDLGADSSNDVTEEVNHSPDQPAEEMVAETHITQSSLQLEGPESAPAPVAAPESDNNSALEGNAQITPPSQTANIKNMGTRKVRAYVKRASIDDSAGEQV